jgi:hypothetical protein
MLGQPREGCEKNTISQLTSLSNPAHKSFQTFPSRSKPVPNVQCQQSNPFGSLNHWWRHLVMECYGVKSLASLTTWPSLLFVLRPWIVVLWPWSLSAPSTAPLMRVSLRGMMVPFDTHLPLTASLSSSTRRITRICLSLHNHQKKLNRLKTQHI